MAHKLIVGTTESGKSTLARAMVADAARRGILIIIYDPTLNPAWGQELVTSDEYEFFSWIHQAHESGEKSILAVVDEADTIMSMSHRHNWWLASRGRHFGIEAIFITQRPTMIAPQCAGCLLSITLSAFPNRTLNYWLTTAQLQALSTPPTCRKANFCAPIG